MAPHNNIPARFLPRLEITRNRPPFSPCASIRRTLSKYPNALSQKWTLGNGRKFIFILNVNAHFLFSISIFGGSDCLRSISSTKHGQPQVKLRPKVEQADIRSTCSSIMCYIFGELLRSTWIVKVLTNW
jgi:hypothetical protein